MDDGANDVLVGVGDYDGTDLHVHQSAVLAPVAALPEGVRTVADGTLDAGVYTLAFVGDDVVDGHLQNLLGGVSEQPLVGGVALFYAPGLGVEEVDALGGPLDHRPVPLLALAQVALFAAEVFQGTAQLLGTLLDPVFQHAVEVPDGLLGPLAALGHEIEGGGEVLHLVAAVHLYPVVQRAATEDAGTLHEPSQRAPDAAPDQVRRCSAHQKTAQQKHDQDVARSPHRISGLLARRRQLAARRYLHPLVEYVVYFVA